MNPLTSFNLSTHELSSKTKHGLIRAPDPLLKRNLQMIEMNTREILAVLSILRRASLLHRLTP